MSKDTLSKLQKEISELQSKIKELDEIKSRLGSLFPKEQIKGIVEKAKAEGRKETIKEIEKFIDNYPKDMGNWHKYYIKTKELKQQIKRLRLKW